MYLAKLLESETDDEHGLTGPQIIQRLAELGIAVERKTLYRDLDCLREFGYIVKYQRSPIEYGLASREFQESELLLLADAVQSSRFLTERKSNALVKAIGKLGSKYLADDLRRNLHVEGRIRSQNESVFYNIDAIGIAAKVGMGNRTNTIMQAAFFKLAQVIPYEDADQYMKAAAKKSYAKKGDAVVKKNWDAIDAAIGGLVENPCQNRKK